MGFLNSVAHVQRHVDNYFRHMRKFLRAYVDDFIGFDKTLDKYIAHLREFFALGFPSIQLLGQMVSSLGTSASLDKVEAILKLKFPQTLAHLNTYIGLVNWFADKLLYLACKLKPLQDRKTVLCRQGPAASRARTNFTRATKITDPSPQEKEAFEVI
jgi:hypothetical protein